MANKEKPEVVSDVEFSKRFNPYVLLEKIDNLAERISVAEDRDTKQHAELKNSFVTLDKKFDEYVTLERHKPVELIAYGLVAGILMAVLGALMSLVVGVQIK